MCREDYELVHIFDGFIGAETDLNIRGQQDTITS